MAGRPAHGGHPQPRAHAGTDAAELRCRRRREVLPAVQRECAQWRVGQLRAVRGQPVRQLRLPVQPPYLRQPRSGLDAIQPDTGARHAHRRQRRRGADQPGLQQPRRVGQHGQRLRAGDRPGAVEPRHRHAAGEGPGPGRVLPDLRGLRRQHQRRDGAGTSRAAPAVAAYPARDDPRQTNR